MCEYPKKGIFYTIFKDYAVKPTKDRSISNNKIKMSHRKWPTHGVLNPAWRMDLGFDRPMINSASQRECIFCDCLKV